MQTDASDVKVIKPGMYHLLLHVPGVFIYLSGSRQSRQVVGAFSKHT